MKTSHTLGARSKTVARQEFETGLVNMVAELLAMLIPVLTVLVLWRSYGVDFF